MKWHMGFFGLNVESAAWRGMERDVKKRAAERVGAHNGGAWDEQKEKGVD